MRVQTPPQRLAVGSTGPAVRKLEQALKARGLLTGAVNNVFDSRTRAAVQRFEARHGWNADGIVGGRIWKRLELSGAAHEGTVAPVTHGKSTFTSVNINVKSNPPMSQAAVVHDVRRAAAAGDIIGWNEIGRVDGADPDRYFKAIRDLGPAWEHYMPTDGKLRIPNPISWKKAEWDKVGEGFARTHHGKAGVSPNRYITWVKLKNKETGRTLIRMNTHLVSGAWSRPRPTTQWRRDMWHVHLRRMKTLVSRFERSGTPVVIGGDFNRNHFPVLGRRVAYDNNLHVGTHGKATLDYMMHLRNPALARRAGRVQGNYRSDHDAVVVKYRLG